MTSLPHPLPSRTAHAIAALYGVEDDTLVAWQRFCAQTAETLRQQHDAERLRKALALAQGGCVEVEDGGFAVVTSGTKLYHVQPDGSCDCPDYAHRRTPCKHVLAVLIHTRAHELAAPSTSPAPAAKPPCLPPRAAQAGRWQTTEAAASCNIKLRVGTMELWYTARDVDDATLQQRLQAVLPWLNDVLLACEADDAARVAARAAAPVPQAPPQAPPAVPPQLDVQALVQQAVQQALAAANGHAASTPPPPASPRASAAPSAPEPDDQQTGFCSIHQVPMEQKSNDRGTWYSHWLRGEQQHCKGRRPRRR